MQKPVTVIKELHFEDVGQCDGCINKETDKRRCRYCKDGSNYEGTDIEQELTYHEFINFVKEL